MLLPLYIRILWGLNGTKVAPFLRNSLHLARWASISCSFDGLWVSLLAKQIASSMDQIGWNRFDTQAGQKYILNSASVVVYGASAFIHQHVTFIRLVLIKRNSNHLMCLDTKSCPEAKLEMTTHWGEHAAHPTVLFAFPYLYLQQVVGPCQVACARPTYCFIENIHEQEFMPIEASVLCTHHVGRKAFIKS